MLKASKSENKNTGVYLKEKEVDNGGPRT